MYGNVIFASRNTGFIQQVGAETDMVHSLTALQSLNHLEMLNLEQTQVSDEALSPLSNFQELHRFSLRSPSLTDVSLRLLSSLSKLTHLSVCDAVLTDYGLGSFRAPEALKFLDLRGCWLLSEDSIRLFCKRNPQIEVRHELRSVASSEQVSSNRPSRSHISSVSPMSKMQEQTPWSLCFIGWKANAFILYDNLFFISFSLYFCESDQRLKYSREELLELQYSALCLELPCDSDTQEVMRLE